MNVYGLAIEAIRWSWGGKNRCDASDPKCGPDGQLRDSLPYEAVPKPTSRISQVVQISFNIGREESGVLRIGLYSDDGNNNNINEGDNGGGGGYYSKSAEQFIQFVTSGLRTTSSLVFESGMGVQSMPVSLQTGGILGQIVPQQRIDFGIPSQAAAFARSRGKSKAGDEFLPQPKPQPLDVVAVEQVIRTHDAAGLLSIPGKGIGYGGSGFASDDETFESAFQITAAANGVPSMEKEGRRVIGQLIDEESMISLARLSSLPTRKGFKGVVPGQNSGPPLLKVTISDIRVNRTGP